MSSLYQGHSIALLTQHGKEKLIAPVLEPALGCHIAHTGGYDTDQLGTFSGEIKRLESQLETARKKAQIGMSLIGARYGIASEGSFIPDPFTGLMPWNIEVVIWIDVPNNLEIMGVAQGPARNIRKPITTAQDLERFALEAGFPEHQVVLRPESPEDPRVHKGIFEWPSLHQTFGALQHLAGNHVVYGESDLRAFSNPTRQTMIQKATHDLLNKIKSTCPSCGSPGFWVTSHETGLPCRMCGHPTKLALREKWTCQSCHFSHETLSSVRTAEPKQCDFCNP
jgi:hypothetical protein